MFTPLTLVLLSLLYVGVLFIIAHWGEALPGSRLTPRWRAVIYSLSLAVYCSSWTFYGAVGSAVSSGWLFVTIYLGPVLMMVLGFDMLRRLLHLTKAQRLTSIADFIAYRYGRGRGLAALVAVAAVLGSLPYIALQLKGVTMALVTVSSGTGGQVAEFPDETALVLALALGLFAILFGAQRLDASEHHRGLMLAVAFESLVKLLAFGAVGLYALYQFLGGPSLLLETLTQTPRYQELFLPATLPHGFLAQTVLAAAAIFCLPRQFHVAFVENEEEGDLRTARWLFPLYLIAFSALVLPIAVAGMEQFGGTGMNADTYVLTLPMAADQPLLTLLSYLGGFSAATGMVIMATVALATMVSNDLVLPLLLRFRVRGGSSFSRVLLHSRRYTILALSLIAWLYYRLIQESEALAALGLVSFAAAVQFAPALIAGVYWRSASRSGALSGLVLGFSAWMIFIVLPPYTPQGWALFGLDFSQAVWLSLGLNSLGLVLGSLWSQHRQTSLPRILAERGGGSISVGALRQLAAYFIGPQRVNEAFSNVLGQSDEALAGHTEQPASAHLISFTERLLAGSIGAASARAVLTTGLAAQGNSRDEALRLLEQTSSAIQFNRGLLEATLDNISQGVSVVDADLRLVSWNRAYLELLNYPSGMVYVGRPVEEVLRFNVQRGLCGPGEAEAQVERRMYHMRRGTPYVFERHQPDGRVIEIRGSPMPQGGYVCTYTDVTHYKRSEEALRASEKRIRFYTDNAPALLAYVDRDLRYRFANRAYRELVGCDDDSLDGQHVEGVLSPSELTKRSPYIEGVLAGKRQQFELSLDQHQNDARYAIGTYIPDVSSTGEVRGFFAVLQDISTRRRAELALQEAYATMEQQVEQRTRELREAMEALSLAKQEAEEANQSKTRFLAAASHDLLQPLNAARLFTSVLTQSAADLPQESAGLVQRVDHSLSAVEELLSALLDISRLDQGAMRPELKTLPVATLLNKVRQQFSELAQRRGLRLRVRDHEALIHSDAKLLLRVLFNLVSNALRYTREGGVLVACRRRGERLLIGVWDTGPGIPEHEQSRIFQEFQRLDKDGDAPGLGLGLAICDRIARMLDAPLDIATREGRGSCFYISVPLMGTGAATSPSIAPLTPPIASNFDNIRVLCLDDEYDILDGMQSLLSRWGCTVMTAGNKDEALDLAVASPPDLLLVDYFLGEGSNGLDVAASIIQRLGQRVPVLVITADQSEAVAERTRRQGYQQLSKPVKPAALKAMMRHLLRNAPA
ncbi:MAG: hypothetical protein Tsb002_32340 [Wenzhouxiangellaceae bacterium]